MSSILYEGSKVNSSVHELKTVGGRFPGVSSRIQSLTSSMVSCRGFNYIGSGVSTTTFSGEIINCNNELNNLITNIRNMQTTILAYSNEEKDIEEFLDSLDKNEFKNLDLSGIESYIGVGRKLSNGFKSLAATLFTAGAGFVEGVAEFVETGADLITLGTSAAASIFTGTYDLITGSDTTKQMWEETRAKVSEKVVENVFNDFYNETEFGREIKENAYHFDTVRGISSGVGYTTSLIALNVVTGGLAGGASQLALTAGVMGFSSGTENAWADGASLKEGLLYGAATGAWEATQWAVGSKINGVGTNNIDFASNIFKGGLKGLITRTVLESADAGIEGFVQPGLTMIYKDYEGNSLTEKYKNAFNENGGWTAVRNQAIMGGIMSLGSEMWDARKIFSSDLNNYNSKIFNDGYLDYESSIYKGISDVDNRENLFTWEEHGSFYSYDSIKNALDNVDAQVLERRADDIFASYGITDSTKNLILSSDGYPNTIKNILDTTARLTSDQKIELTELLSSKVFTEANAARIRAQCDIYNGNYERALELVSSPMKSNFEQYSDLLVATSTYGGNDCNASKYVYYNIIDSFIDNGFAQDEAIRQAKLIYANAMEKMGDEASKQIADKLFKSNSQLFGIPNDVFEGYELLETSLGNKTMFPSSYIDGDRMKFYELSTDFDKMIKGVSGIPYFVDDYDFSRASQARDLFVDSFDDVLKGNYGSYDDAARVMAKLIELDNLFVYNNNGRSCSHSQSNVINLDNMTVDSRGTSVVFHETGHYLFSNVLGEVSPSNYDSVRLNAINNYNSGINKNLISGLQDTISEAKIYSEYKATKIFNENLKAAGYDGIDGYKKYLYAQYSNADINTRIDMFHTSLLQNGDVTIKDLNSMYHSYNDVNYLVYADYNSNIRKITNAFHRIYFDDLVTTSSMIDSLTMGDVNLWYGHDKTYFNSSHNPQMLSYHELIADYTSLKINGDTKTLGFLRNLFGDDLINMLENTYQEMVR